MEPSTQRSIAERAASQLGHITREQLQALDLSYDRIEGLVRSARLEPAGDRTYRIAGVPPSWEGGVMAACLDQRGVASHRTAARLHGLHGFETCQTIELTVIEGRAGTRSSLAAVHRTTCLPVSDIATVGPIPTTSIARTALGLAALVGEVSTDELRDAIDAAVRDGIATDRWLWWLLESRRCRGRNGVCRMEDVLQARAGCGPTESWLEREFLRVVERGGLRPPIVQRRVRSNGAFVARIDATYEPEMIAIEVKGHASHSTVKQLIADSRRENALLLAGYRLLSFTFDDIVNHARYVVRTIESALRTLTAAS